ncbi:MAG: hypothetical protein A3I88_00390 [Candidatus Portnoybacteria bacterium RIFCSPLOWO2_12_FULL_39_9]|uniref:Polyprenyl synthetase n=1 Tax=Candidatus Portnoybacteria bacterium RIFCSPHIGHO2_12_FULL_38_9 TaxID=1801997 RepID=A0A1G2FDW3_9BACT|nr:MAG: hypothetical protein A3H00_02530 [Candidatus Portnoybacteria bacterium RBG_13_40_8]OGZ36254.1 MAG: hypothetical protein A3J64_00415 [Candidatus Portnoybacteria bacterium RIFCSPHIGHO2_12_FULL_38_9]OGZ36943.1 MAG: hypothetical protein A2646_03565 [Candidatus Portnoybacteria bacterium RIFCSPHIGHO2_02_FULL_39_12]OGZ37991.1 MAG: hypothetical protein A3F21_01510 [Candidatus Portnoybacteria bacterium RIFCSPLOWO2_01_FULL_38_39]OGZ40072.1 MAG: hypothetical protein A3I88_00390 [Candidatus Portnoy
MFHQTLLKYQRKIDSELKIFFDKKIKESFLISKEAVETVNLLKDYTLRKGKRLRALLVNLGYFSANGKNRKGILKASLAIELIHNFLLIHDDIIDQDRLRRGQLSLHSLYQKKFFNNQHTGISLAMISGDIISVWGYENLINSDFDEKLKIKAIKILNETIEKTCYGEMIELILKKRKIAEKDILNISKYKTAYYTFVNPLKIGAVLAGRDRGFLEKIEKFGLPLGIAFQIQDDILGLFGSQKEIGKPIGSDIKENQPNLLIFKTLTLANLKDRQKFKNYLGQPTINQKDIREIKRIVKESGSLKYCRRKAGDLIKKAKYFLKQMKIPQKEKQFLKDLADYIIIRNY